MSKKPESHEVPRHQTRPPLLPAPEIDVSFDDWIAFIREHYPTQETYLRLLGSMLCQIHLHNITQPCGLIITGAPSSGKTLLFRHLGTIGDEIIYYTHKITGAAFLSNSPGKTAKELEKVDLLPKMRFKLTLIPEMGAVLHARGDTLKHTVSNMLSALDGNGMTADTGAHGRRQCGDGATEDWMLCLAGATTPVRGEVLDEMWRLGPRFFFVHFRMPDLSDAEVDRRLLIDWKDVLEESQRMTQQFFRGRLGADGGKGRKFPFDKITPQITGWLRRMAKLLARGREAETAETWEMLNRESVDRALHTLKGLACGHSNMARGTQGFLKMEDLAPCLLVTLESLRPPTNHVMSALFRKLKEGGPPTLYVADVQAEIGRSEEGAEDAMNLAAGRGFGICGQDPSSPGKPRKTWTITGTDLEWLASPELVEIAYRPNPLFL